MKIYNVTLYNYFFSYIFFLGIVQGNGNSNFHLTVKNKFHVTICLLKNNRTSPYPPAEYLQIVLHLKQRALHSIKNFEGWLICGKQSAQIGYLGMHVHRDFRRQGVGRALLKQGLEDSKQYGFHRVELYVYKSNINAIKLYKQFKFYMMEELDIVTLPSGKETTNIHLGLGL